MKVAESNQTDQMQQMINTNVQDTSLKLFTEETYNSLTMAGAEEMTHQFNQ